MRFGQGVQLKNETRGKSIIRLLLLFFFFEKKVKTLYYGKSSWKTSSKSCGRSSNHTSVSGDETARRARAWANYHPFA